MSDGMRAGMRAGMTDIAERTETKETSPDSELWRIVRGHPNGVETAVLTVVLSAMFRRSDGISEQVKRTVPSGWDRTPNSRFRSAGTWRHG